ncbi:MAG TPA: MetQ/NlpA family ABC transporter substrate-binding protein [Symbiobacteriaceae bacterium]|nr:MetQ/NlpA family ABC transporter substrate-binding protein [Symbiobacteriaceae bacterium]
MKRISALLLASVLSVGILAGCGAKKEETTTAPTPTKAALTTIKVGAVPVPHAEILKHIQPAAEKEGLKIEIVEFTDYVQPNLALADKQLDANYFQHVPYLNTFSADRKLSLASVGPVHLEPLGLYSTKVKSLAEIKEGAQIAIPDDPSNTGRSLVLLAQQGLIKLKDGVGVKATPADIVENPKKLKITLMNAEVLPRTLADTTASIINGNYYLEAEKTLKLNATVLARESAKENPYANIVAVRKGDEARPEIQKLVKLLQSDDVKKFIEQTYNGAVIPAF